MPVIIILLLLLLLLSIFPDTIMAAGDVQNNFAAINLTSTDNMVKPGAIKTILVKVVNHSHENLKIAPEVVLPRNWFLITPLNSYQIRGGSSQLIILPVQVDSYSKPGVYEVGVILKNDSIKNKKVTAEIKVDLQQQLNLKCINFKDFVTADSYVLQYLLTNKSNISQKIYLKVKDNLNFKYKLTPASLELKPGQKQLLSIKVLVNQDLKTSCRHNLKLIASAKTSGIEEVRDSIKTSVSIIPSRITSPLKQYSFPVKIYLKGKVSSDFSNHYLSLEGKSIIDNRIKGEVIFNSNHKLISIDHPDYRLGLGDQVFSQQALQKKMTGRGFNFKIKQKHWDWQFYHYLDNNEQEQFGMGISGQINQKVDLYFNYDPVLETTSGNNRYSLRTSWQPVSSLNLDLIYQDKSDDNIYPSALKVSGKIDGPEWSSVINWKQSYPLEHNSKLNTLNHIYCNSNYDGDDFYVNFLYKKSREQKTDFIRFNTTEKLKIIKNLKHKRDSNINESKLGYYYQESVNQKTNQFQIKKDSFRQKTGIFSKTFGKNNDWYYQELGYYSNSNRLKSDSYNYYFYKYMSQLKYGKHEFKPALEFKLLPAAVLDLELKHSYQYLPELTINTDIGIKTLLKNRFKLQTITGSTNIKFGEKNNVKIDYKWFKDYFKSELALTYQYSIPIDINLSLNSETGSFSGYLIDENGQGLSNIRIMMGKFSTLTRTDGYFEFPAVSPGIKYLSISRQHLDSNFFIRPRLPWKINIKPGSNIQQNFKLIPPAKVSGKIEVVAVKSALKNGYISGRGFKVKKEELINKLDLSLVSSKRSYNCQPDLEGCFYIDNLNPGQWKLIINSEKLSDLYQVKVKKSSFNIKPGAHKNININIKPRIRSLKMKKGEVIKTKKY